MLTKVQIISKLLFGILEFSQKRNKRTRCSSKHEFIHLFFGRIRDYLTLRFNPNLKKNGASHLHFLLFLCYLLKHWCYLFNCAHSQFGHYFCSNLYGSAPRGPRGVKKLDFFFHKWNCFPFALRLPPKDTNFKNHQNWRKNVKKTLFSLTFLNLIHFGGNISAPNLK